jgi:hypothetical protein
MQTKLKTGGKNRSKSGFQSRKAKPQRHKKASFKDKDKITKMIRKKIEKRVAERVVKVNERLRMVEIPGTNKDANKPQ